MPAQDSITFFRSLVPSCNTAGGELTYTVNVVVNGTGGNDPIGPYQVALLNPAGDVVSVVPVTSNNPVAYSGLLNGRYTAELESDDGSGSGSGGGSYINTISATVNCTVTGGGTTGQLDITVDGVDAPAARAGTGTVRLNVANAVGNATVYLYLNPPGPVAYTSPPGTSGIFAISGVAAGYYGAQVIDSAGRIDGVPFTMPEGPLLGCTDPVADNYDPLATVDDGSCAYTPPQRYPHFRFSPAQSLRFVQPGDATLPLVDNHFFADERPLNLTNPGYCQKVERGDTLVVQWQSNYTGAHALRVLPCDGTTAALTVAPVRVVVGAGMSQAFEAYARAEPTNTGRTRLYFNSDALPLPFLPGARVTLTNAPGLNGTYPVTDVREDPAAGVPYLVLSTPYPSGAQRIDLNLSTPYLLQSFDTWQAVVPFSSIAEGCFRVHVTGVDTEFGTAEAVSEPVDVAIAHPDTVVVVYRNFDNAFGLNYTAGLVNRVRVVGRFFGLESPTQKTTLRESNGVLALIEASIQRRRSLVTYLLPDYVHEKLAVAFCHDFVRVNDLKGIAEESYTYPPTPGYTLTNGEVRVEQEDFLGAGNRDDVGDVDGGDVLLLVNNQFLKVNP